MPDSRDDAFEQLLRQVAETPHVSGGRPRIGPGVRLAGRFEILDKLGEGGMGQVFAAVDHERRTRVAVKVLGKLTPASIAQIKGEFRAAAEIVNPNLVRLHELFSDDDLWFFTMDIVEGVTLPALLRKRPEVGRDVALLVPIFRQLALALSALHASRTLHRDLKPSNFIVTEPDHRVVLLDFGLARPPDASRGPGTDLAGTPVYMAPEQVLGEALTEAADWYAFGVVLYEALAGKLPLGRPSPASLDGAPPELARLCLRLLCFDPGQRPTAEDVLVCLGVPPEQIEAAQMPESATLIGRRHELQALEAAFAQTVAGRPAMVLVEGPSGIGKSALVEHFLRAARQRGALVLTGRCRERESMGYKAADGLIDSIVGFLDGLPEHEALALLPPDIADLTILFPALRAAAAVSRTPARKNDTPDRAVARRQAIAAFGTMLATFRRRAPVVVSIDDLQWSDEESALLLGPVLGGPAPVPLLFVGSTRSGPGGGGPLLDALAADGTLRLPEPRPLPLAPLSLEQAERLALQLLPAGDSAALARKICGEAGGHPLFIAELAHSARFPSRAAGAPSPSTLSELVTKRVAALPEATRAFLEVAAVAGAPLARSVLRQTQRLGPAEAERIIDVLRANRLARSQGLTDEDPVDVHHDRIREIVMQNLPGERRQRCHLDLAQTLEAQQGVKPEVVATHYQAAQELASAGRYWIRAADQALGALAFGHAAELYQKGIAQAVHGSDAEARAVNVRWAEALAYAGKGADAAAVYQRTADHCRPDQAVELRRRAAEQLLLSGHLEQGLGVIEDVLRAIEMPPTRGGRKALLSLVARRAYLRARGLRHRTHAENELSRAQLAQLDASWTIACSLGALDFMRGAEFQAKHLLLALRAGEPRRLLRALTLEVAYAATPGPGSERRTNNLLSVADELAQKSHDEAATSLLCLNRGIAAYLQGRLYEALKHCEEAIYILGRRSVGAVWEMVTAQRFVIASLFFLGRLRRLVEFVPPLLAEAERNGNLYATMCFRSAYSTVSWLAEDAVGEARRQLDRARDEWKAEGFQLSHCNVLIGESFHDFYIGDAEKAFARFEEQWPLVVGAQLHRISVLRVQLGHLRAASALAVAGAAEARGQRARGRELRGRARAGARALRRDHVRRAAPLADLLEAAVDRAENDAAGAKRLLERCIRAFEEQGMELFSAAARVRLGELLGGARGQLLVETARAELRHEGVKDPTRMVDLLAPGFPSADR